MTKRQGVGVLPVVGVGERLDSVRRYTTVLDACLCDG